MKQVGVLHAKKHLSRLLAAVQQGERVAITRRGKPVAVLVSPKDVQAEHQNELVDELAAIRARSRPGPESIAQLRDEGRHNCVRELAGLAGTGLER